MYEKAACLLAGTEVRKFGSVACRFNSIKNYFSVDRIYEVHIVVFSIKYRYSIAIFY